MLTERELTECGELAVLARKSLCIAGGEERLGRAIDRLLKHIQVQSEIIQRQADLITRLELKLDMRKCMNSGEVG